MFVDPVEHGARRRVDHGERRLELVDDVLEESPPCLLGSLEARGEAVEGAAEGPDLIGPVRKAGTSLEIAAGDRSRGPFECPEGPGDAPRKGESQERRARCRDEGDHDQGDHRVLLDLQGVRAGHGTRAASAPQRAPGRRGSLHEGEPAADDRRGGERHGTGGQQRDEGEGCGEEQAQAHGLAAR